MPYDGGNFKAEPKISNPARMLACLMETWQEWDSGTLARRTGIPVRTIQRLKLECATHAIGGVSSEYRQCATHAVHGATGTANDATDGAGTELAPPRAQMESSSKIVSTENQQQQQQYTAADANEIYEQLSSAAGKALSPVAVGLHVVSDVIGWISDGADFELDILPTVKALARRTPAHKINSWGYFRQAVAEAKAKRERGLPDVIVSESGLPFKVSPNTVRFAKPLLDEPEAAHA